MASWLANRITEKLIAAAVIEDDDRELYIYGFFLLISKTVFLVVTMLVGYFMGVWLESVILYFSFLFLRAYAGGIHAKTEAKCTVLTTIALLLSILTIRQFEMQKSEILPFFMLGFGVLSVWLFSPLDTKEKPLNQEEKSKYKKISIFITLIYIIVVIIAKLTLLYLLVYAVSCGVFLESILLISGKIFDQLGKYKK